MVHIEQSPSAVKEKVMKQIMDGKVKMTSPFFILMRKIGIRTTIIFSLLVSGLCLSVMLYILKKTSLLGYLSFGIPGIKVFLLSFPYDYLGLFLITILTTVFIYNKIDIPCERRYCFRTMTLGTFFVSILLGLGFFLLGVHSAIQGWDENRLSESIATCGIVKDIQGNEIIVEETDGHLVKINVAEVGLGKKEIEQFKGKTIQAVGSRNIHGNVYTFDAQDVQCIGQD
jgi:hypothetical protein